MNTAEMLLIATLLTSPPGITEQSPPEAQWPAIQQALHKVALEWEILDSRETHYIGAKREEFSIDINLLRRRYVQLKDAPKVIASDMLPASKVINEAVKENRKYREYLMERAAFERDREDILYSAVTETDYLHATWDAARDAKCTCYYITTRRLALQKLKDLIGDQAFYEAKLPPNVPVWRMPQR